jgi:anthranilate/para-aminobenzoate synthase component I
MKLVARRLDVRPDALGIARALSGEPGFAFLWSASGGGPSYVACWPVDAADTLDPEEALPLAPSLSALSHVPRWIGLLPYEARRSLERASRVPPEARPMPHVSSPLWQRYGAVVRIQEDVLVVGDDAARVRALAQRIRLSAARSSLTVSPLPSEDTDDAHRARVARALEAIVRGDIYQVNLARRFDFRIEGSTLELLERLVEKAPGPFALAAAFGGLSVAASSPELFLELSARGGLRTVPIKGTRPRGKDAREDAALARELDDDPKERAELSMVVDVERNDLGRIARTGSVRVPGNPRVESFGTVWHRSASVVGVLRAGVGRHDVLLATLPSGSVTGAPKIRAMELIASWEAARRGLYTGAFGFVAHDGSLRLAMAIRTVTMREGVAHYFAGGGIVFGSDPDREVLETRWKSAQILRLLDEEERVSGR